MKYVYFYLWVLFANFHKIISAIFKPIHTTLYKWKGKSKDELIKWREEYDESFLRYPGGMWDWFAFGLLAAICYIPIIYIAVKYKIDIFTKKYFFVFISIILFCLLYYIIYFRNREWLTDKINKVNKKYYS